MTMVYILSLELGLIKADEIPKQEIGAVRETLEKMNKLYLLD